MKKLLICTSLFALSHSLPAKAFTIKNETNSEMTFYYSSKDSNDQYRYSYDTWVIKARKSLIISDEQFKKSLQNMLIAIPKNPVLPLTVGLDIQLKKKPYGPATVSCSGGGFPIRTKDDVNGIVQANGSKSYTITLTKEGNTKVLGCKAR